MRTKILALGLVCLFLISLSADEKEALNSFEAIVAKFGKFMSTSPVVLVSRESGKVNYLLKFELLNLTYDIQRTNSLVTPYVAHVVMTLKVLSNAKYGDVKRSDSEAEYNWGFQRAEDAKKIKKFASCSSYADPKKGWRCRGDVKLLYAYQHDSWVLSEVDTEGPERLRTGRIRDDIKGIFLRNSEWRKAMHK